MSRANWGPAYGVTKDDHDVIVATRGRNLTDDCMREARPDEDMAASRPSIVDRYITANRREAPTP